MYGEIIAQLDTEKNASPAHRNIVPSNKQYHNTRLEKSGVLFRKLEKQYQVQVNPTVQMATGQQNCRMPGNGSEQLLFGVQPFLINYASLNLLFCFHNYFRTKPNQFPVQANKQQTTTKPLVPNKLG